MAEARQPIAGCEWYDIDNPNSPALDELAKRFHLHELQIEDCRHRPQRAKVEEHPAYIFAVLKALRARKPLGFEDLDFFLGANFVITVHAGRSAFVDRLAERLLHAADTRLDRLVYLLVDSVVDEYMPVLDEIADQTANLERDVLRRPDPPALHRIFHLKRALIEFRRTSSAMREVVNGLMRRERGLLGDDLDPYFRDVYDHLVRTVELVETYRDLLTGSLDIYLSAVANRTNEVMKALTVYGTVALPLVIITGFFGMNLHLPWSDNPHGVWYASGLMAISALVVWLYFRVKRIF